MAEEWPRRDEGDGTSQGQTDSVEGLGLRSRWPRGETGVVNELWAVWPGAERARVEGHRSPRLRLPHVARRARGVQVAENPGSAVEEKLRLSPDESKTTWGEDGGGGRKSGGPEPDPTWCRCPGLPSRAAWGLLRALCDLEEENEVSRHDPAGKSHQRA